MSSDLCSTSLPLPKNWKQSIKSAVIHTLSLAFKSITLTLSQGCFTALERDGFSKQPQTCILPVSRIVYPGLNGSGFNSCTTNKLLLDQMQELIPDH